MDIGSEVVTKEKTKTISVLRTQYADNTKTRLEEGAKSSELNIYWLRQYVTLQQ